MGRIYDNWERLVKATLKREEFRELARVESRSPSVRSASSDISSINSFNSPLHHSMSDNFSGPQEENNEPMDLFGKAAAVQLKSAHDKYLMAEKDEETVTQNRNGSSTASKWAVEFVHHSDGIIRLKSCYGKFLTATNHPFLLGMMGRKVAQTLPSRLDSSVEWELVREGKFVKLKTRYGQFLLANGGLSPWKNSVTHDTPHRTATQEWILWGVHVVEILVAHSLVAHPDSFASNSTPPPWTQPPEISSFSRQESNDSLVSLPPRWGDGRLIYFHRADEQGRVDEGFEELCVAFRGNGVQELTMRLEEELGMDGAIVCTCSPLNGRLYPLRLQLPPNNATMHVVVVPSSSQAGQDLATMVMPF